LQQAKKFYHISIKNYVQFLFLSKDSANQSTITFYIVFIYNISLNTFGMVPYGGK